jgi:hypothetical protein
VIKMNVRGIDTTTRGILRRKGQQAQGSSFQMLTYAICSAMEQRCVKHWATKIHLSMDQSYVSRDSSTKPQPSVSCLYPRSDVQPCQGLPHEGDANAMQAS